MRTDGSSRRRVALRRRIERVLRDDTSGAAEIAAAASRLLEDATALGYSPHRLSRLKQQLTQAHAAMASVWHVVNADDPAKYSAALKKKSRETVRLARKKLPKKATMVTISYSSSVIAATARKGRIAYVAESQPGGEGQRTARALKRLGAESHVVPDSALVQAAGKADFGIIGADAVTPTHVVNKVGSHLLALACTAMKIPFYVVADSSKWVDEDWTIPEYGKNLPFETVPRELTTEILSDSRLA